MLAQINAPLSAHCLTLPTPNPAALLLLTHTYHNRTTMSFDAASTPLVAGKRAFSPERYERSTAAPEKRAAHAAPLAAPASAATPHHRKSCSTTIPASAVAAGLAIGGGCAKTAAHLAGLEKLVGSPTKPLRKLSRANTTGSSSALSFSSAASFATSSVPLSGLTTPRGNLGAAASSMTDDACAAERSSSSSSSPPASLPKIPVVALEAIIGAGKSTLLDAVKAHFGDAVVIVHEPVGVWTDVDGHNLLGAYYKDQKVHAHER